MTVAMNPPFGSRAYYTSSFSGTNELWLRWYATGQRDAQRTLQFNSRFRPCSRWVRDQEAWRRGFADQIMEVTK